MPAVKVVDCDGRQQRRAKLWECFGGLFGINTTNIKDGGNGHYYVIVPEDKIEQIIKEESKQKLRDHKFEIHTPIEYNAMRTIIVRHLDKVVSEYNDKEIINNIEATNEWAKVEFVYKLTDTGRMLKIRFNTTEMAARAVRDGLIVAYQRISPRYIEKEIFVKLTPCYNCHSYDHKTQSCEIEKESICAFCAKKRPFTKQLLRIKSKMHQLRRQAQDPSFSLSSRKKNNKRKKQRCTRTISVTVTSKACNICRSGNSQTTAATAAIFLTPYQCRRSKYERSCLQNYHFHHVCSLP